MVFPCVKCGACCKFVGMVPHLWDDVVKPKEDGSCVHLTADNRCDIYETRPDKCRIDKTCPKGTDVTDWYQVNLASCEQLYGLLNNGKKLPVEDINE